LHDLAILPRFDWRFWLQRRYLGVCPQFVLKSVEPYAHVVVSLTFVCQFTLYANERAVFCYWVFSHWIDVWQMAVSSALHSTCIP
jgi:hypothetical protein